MLYFSHYLISGSKFSGDEIMAKMQHQFWQIKMDVKTANSSKKKLTYLRISVSTSSGTGFHSDAIPVQIKQEPIVKEEVTISPCISPVPGDDCFSQDMLVPRPTQDTDLDCFFSYTEGKQVRKTRHWPPYLLIITWWRWYSGYCLSVSMFE